MVKFLLDAIFTTKLSKIFTNCIISFHKIFQQNLKKTLLLQYFNKLSMTLTPCSHLFKIKLLDSLKLIFNLYLNRDKEQETSVIKKSNDFISFKFGDVQFLDLVKFLGGAITMDSFLKVYKASDTKGFLPYVCFENPDKIDFPELPPYEAFFSKLRNNKPQDKDFEYEKLRKSGLDEQQALKKLQI